MTGLSEKVDVIVVGGGGAAMAAAITAAERSARVLVLEAAPKDFRGGNTRHVRNIRYAHNAATDFVTGAYPVDEYYDDLLRVTQGNTDKELSRFLIERSEDAADWMTAHGVRFQPPLSGTIGLDRTNAFFKGGGKALLNAYYATAEKLGIECRYEAEVTDLVIEDGAFTAARVRHQGREHTVEARALVVAAGGFQADIDWLKEGWGEAAEGFLIRGTGYNKGRMLRVLMDRGAQTAAEADQCHAIAIDARSPKCDGGIATRVDCVIYSIMVNRKGQRFYDEGEDIWPKRYAIWGRLLARQEDQIAFGIVDAKANDLFMPSMYPPLKSDTIRGLAKALELDPGALEKTVAEYNAACRPGEFKPEVLDGLATEGLTPPKSNWARPVDTPPYYGYPLKPGITFTYLGVKVDKQARVQFTDAKGRTVPAANIFAAGEVMSGNILGQGYAGGVGMAIGLVFGRVAGEGAARLVSN
ncbi:MAG: tricarballylate dehydrogenase [Rhodospirillales bacterium CG15_BIG_FIL_POST_REV_8_21_14_020_66_15]|nr:MAG: tricarballylate dehydrogenase [Rhodospirillales bacterium CG15_BIG_FIL_POST_REV_8_21_14_020_66_15]